MLLNDLNQSTDRHASSVSGVVELLVQKVTSHYNIIYEVRSEYACGTKLDSLLGCRGTCVFLDSPQVFQRSLEDIEATTCP